MHLEGADAEDEF
jgi:DnaJ-class molecular chaperone